MVSPIERVSGTDIPTFIRSGKILSAHNFLRRRPFRAVFSGERGQLLWARLAHSVTETGNPHDGLWSARVEVFIRFLFSLNDNQIGVNISRSPKYFYKEYLHDENYIYSGYGNS